MKTFKCVKAWPRHSVGEVIPESEYNKLPQEIKDHGNFQLVEDEIPSRPLTKEEVKLEEQSAVEAKEVFDAIAPDVLNGVVIDPFVTKRKKYEQPT